jgi:hypothetical protein
MLLPIGEAAFNKRGKGYGVKLKSSCYSSRDKKTNS